MNAAAATSRGLQLNDFANLLHGTRPAASQHNALSWANIVEQITGALITCLYTYPKGCSLCQKHSRFMHCSLYTKFFFLVLFSISMMSQRWRCDRSSLFVMHQPAIVFFFFVQVRIHVASLTGVSQEKKGKSKRISSQRKEASWSIIVIRVHEGALLQRRWHWTRTRTRTYTVHDTYSLTDSQGLCSRGGKQTRGRWNPQKIPLEKSVR